MPGVSRERGVGGERGVGRDRGVGGERGASGGKGVPPFSNTTAYTQHMKKTSTHWRSGRNLST